MANPRIIPIVVMGGIVLCGALLLRRESPVVIGGEMVEARGRDRLHARSRRAGDSPLPAQLYDPARGEHHMLNPSRVPVDSALADVARRYAVSGEQARARMRDAIDMDGFYELHTFARRAAVFALRERSAQPVRDGLAAMAMVDPERMDARDIPDAVALLHHAATRIGADADALMREAGALAEPGMARMLTGFASRPAAEKDLREGWGWEEVRTADGPGFVRRGFEAYQPTRDLVSTAAEIGGILEADQYFADDPEIAAELPPVWLRPATPAAVEPALGAVRAGVTVAGNLRPTAHPRYNEQQLTVFLVELADEQDARALLDASRPMPGRRHALLGVAEGRLFCLVVARAYVEGVESYETTERLARFAAPLAAILRRHAGG